MIFVFRKNLCGDEAFYWKVFRKPFRKTEKNRMKELRKQNDTVLNKTIGRECQKSASTIGF